MRLKGKRAFVTAAGAGIGQACARAFVAEGAEVIATDVNEAALAPLADEGVTVARLDVTDSAAVRAAAESAGGIDILMHCAGFVHDGSILDCDDEAYDFSFGLNAKGMHNTARAFLPDMLERGGGSIIAIASVASSMIAVPNRYVYGASKAAVIGQVKAIAADFVARGIRANAICPGTVDSPSLQARIQAAGEKSGDLEGTRKAFVARQPMGRLGRTDEIAALAVYLASDESAFVTGQAIAIDGGWVNV